MYGSKLTGTASITQGYGIVGCCTDFTDQRTKVTKASRQDDDSIWYERTVGYGKRVRERGREDSVFGQTLERR